MLGICYWWLFRDLDDKVEAAPEHRGPIVREAFDALEKEFEAGVPEVLKRAVRLRKAGQPAASVAQGVIAESHWDDGWMYRIEVTGGDECRDHRDDEGQLWVCDFEVTTREA